MKTTLISLTIATLLGSAFAASGLPLDAGDFIALAFAVGLAAWTFQQYSHEPRSLTRVRPLHLSAHPALRRKSAAVHRIAA